MLEQVEASLLYVTVPAVRRAEAPILSKAMQATHKMHG
jgi:hypothetical protein